MPPTGPPVSTADTTNAKHTARLIQVRKCPGTLPITRDFLGRERVDHPTLHPSEQEVSRNSGAACNGGTSSAVHKQVLPRYRLFVMASASPIASRGPTMGVHRSPGTAGVHRHRSLPPAVKHRRVGLPPSGCTPASPPPCPSPAVKRAGSTAPAHRGSGHTNHACGELAAVEIGSRYNHDETLSVRTWGGS